MLFRGISGSRIFLSPHPPREELLCTLVARSYSFSSSFFLTISPKKKRLTERMAIFDANIFNSLISAGEKRRGAPRDDEAEDMS